MQHNVKRNEEQDIRLRKEVSFAFAFPLSTFSLRGWFLGFVRVILELGNFLIHLFTLT